LWVGLCGRLGGGVVVGLRSMCPWLQAGTRRSCGKGGSLELDRVS